MIEELQKESIKAGMNINIAKTEFIVNKCITDTWKITINDEETKRSNNFVYLGQALGIIRNTKTETNRRISQDQCILPVMTCGSEV